MLKCLLSHATTTTVATLEAYNTTWQTNAHWCVHFNTQYCTHFKPVSDPSTESMVPFSWLLLRSKYLHSRHTHKHMQQ